MLTTIQESVDNLWRGRSNKAVLWHGARESSAAEKGVMSQATAVSGRSLRMGGGPGCLFAWLSLLTAAICPAMPLRAGEYRGMAAGWPVYANGTYPAGYVPDRAAAGPAYYVARPAVRVAPGAAPAGMFYAPVRVAYANPLYYAAYGRTAGAPVMTTGYAPGYAAPAGYAAPTSVNYAPANSYSVTPAGLGGGSEGMAYYGQSTALNYVPPRFAYRTTYAAVPVYAYRPMTAYDPVVGQPTTCLQPATTSTCQPQRQSCSSWWNPFTWFSRGSCRGGGCGGCGAPPAATTAYCCGSSSCGQPYYPVQPMTPVVPVVPAPAITTPGVPMNVIPAFPSGRVPAATPTIPPTPTRIPGGFGTTLAPADQAPRLTPGIIPTTPAPGGTYLAPSTGGAYVAPPPGTTIAPAPGGITPLPSAVPPTSPPGGSFPTAPAVPSTGGFGTGGFGTGANYPPAIDPYVSTNSVAPMTPPAAPSKGGAAVNEKASEPAHSVFGSGYRANSSSRGDSRQSTDNSGPIRSPELRPALPPNVRTVPDLDTPAVPPADNRAPQLLSPRDKTALNAGSKWAVVPAVWPSPPIAQARQLSERPVVATKAFAPAAERNAADYDDRGWKSAR
jgi:hypothetical protein